MTEQLLINNDRHYRLAEKVKQQGELLIEMQNNAIIQIMSDLINCRDNDTGEHVSRISEYLKIIIEELVRSGYYENEIHEINIKILPQSALLHDIGKIAIPDAILQKNSKLSEQEFETIKTHTVIGAKTIERAMVQTKTKNFLSYARIIALSHHEKWNGTGYPLMLMEKEIPLIGRLTAIVDVYDALVSARPYKLPFSHEKAVEIIKESSNSHFDPKLCDVFLRVETKFAQLFYNTKSEGKRKVII